MVEPVDMGAEIIEGGPSATSRLWVAVQGCSALIPIDPSSSIVLEDEIIQLHPIAGHSSSLVAAPLLVQLRNDSSDAVNQDQPDRVMLVLTSSQKANSSSFCHLDLLAIIPPRHGSPGSSARLLSRARPCDATGTLDDATVVAVGQMALPQSDVNPSLSQIGILVPTWLQPAGGDATLSILATTAVVLKAT